VSPEDLKMTDKHVDVYDLYISAWSAISDEERLRRLRASVAEAIIFRNAMKTRNSLADVVEHLEAFQKRSPGGSFRLMSMLGFENRGLATWKFFDAEGQGGFSGFDALTFDEDGRISYILMFSDVEKQRLK
jgi:SnoaL-like domain